MTANLEGYSPINRLRALHRPFKIYGECEHEHTQEDVDSGLAIDIDEIGINCEDGYLYSICAACCCYDGEQSEDCANNHAHGKDIPICPTREILDATKETGKDE